MDITCQDCGAVRRNVMYRNTKFCNACRLLRDVLYQEKADACPRTCGRCERTFAALKRSDKLCGRCAEDEFVIGTCALCLMSAVGLYREGLDVCHWCVRAPAARQHLIAWLRAEQHGRRTANRWSPQEKPKTEERERAMSARYWSPQEKPKTEERERAMSARYADAPKHIHEAKVDATIRPGNAPMWMNGRQDVRIRAGLPRKEPGESLPQFAQRCLDAGLIDADYRLTRIPEGGRNWFVNSFPDLPGALQDTVEYAEDAR